jgi:serine/threonine-protein kinase
VLDGKYRVVEQLGEGAMGVVLLGRDEALDRDVAIKFFHPHLAPESKALFLAEARAMARIRQDNVVSIHAFGDYHGAPYFVMEYLPGSDLATWLDANVPLSVDEALGVLAQVCAGVQAIHDAGTVHYDLKPENVMVGPSFRLAVTDFGLARLLKKKARVTVVGGSPEYMAPELAGTESVPSDVALRADIYSLGVIAYELLTGDVPFDGSTVWAVIAQHQTAPPRPPSERRQDLPPAFDAPVLSALSKDPTARPASAREFFHALQAVRETFEVPRGATRVLVADDDKSFRDFAQVTLEEGLPGATVTCVADGEQALSSLERGAVDVAVIDLKMPKLNGLELVAALHADPRLRGIRVMIVTAYGGAKDWKILSNLGASAFLLKPIEPSDLADAVRRLLGLPSVPPPNPGASSAAGTT